MPQVVLCLLPLLLGLAVQSTQSTEMVQRRLTYPCAPEGHTSLVQIGDASGMLELHPLKRAWSPWLWRLRRGEARKDLTAQGDPPPLWSCPSQKVWVDLGEHAFPRYVLDMRCLHSSCWHGHLACQPITSIREVLVRQNGSCLETRLPPDLARKFLFAEMTCTSGCRCGPQD